MADEGAVNAPVTRLKRRMSMEQSDDAKSLSASNTPTKKSGGRKVAKPELELIDENAPESDTSKKNTKKTKAKELEVDEKPVTPSRRSARIKSNTSIHTVDSPRAKRALRRNSLVASDNETPLTPARVTRRTRKDSANIDKAELQGAIKTVPEIIVEEPDTVLQKSQSNTDKSIEGNESPSHVRKSVRLSLKKNEKSSSSGLSEQEENKTENLNNNTSNDSIESNEKELIKSDNNSNANKENKTSENTELHENTLPYIKLTDISTNLNNIGNIKLSDSNVESLNKLNSDPKTQNKNINKSFPASTLTYTEYLKSKRHRTKSWAGLSIPIKNDNTCYSDSESNKKAKMVLLNTSNTENTKNVLGNFNKSSNAKEKSILDMSVQKEEKNLVGSSSNKGKLFSPPINNIISSTNWFEKEPTSEMRTLVYIDESDSNSEKNNINHEVREHQEKLKQQIDNTQNILNFNKDNEENLNKTNTCEPMDIDESLPHINISNNSPLETDMSQNILPQKVNLVLNSIDMAKTENKRSSEISSKPQDLDTTTTENKSTLLTLKDISNENNVSESPQIASEKKLDVDQTLNTTQDNQADKKNLSSNYLTSTPLQQKHLLKHAIQVNTSDILKSNNTSEIDKCHLKLNESNTNISHNTSEKSELNESLQEECSFMDEEAEDAGDDYESGDSRDEEDEQYERDHEILQKGETLTSEDELSNDTDYEKDSFVVSSDQEDNDLLDGSGDDLSMSENELKMTTKSKKKYNERKIKAQKEASKEMFESRHKLNVSNISNHTNLAKINKNRAILDSSDSEDEKTQVKIKKNKRMRLDSDDETSINKSSENVSQIQSNNSLSKSVNKENDTKAVEMAVNEHDMKGEIDLLPMEKKKESITPHKINTSMEFIELEQSEKPDQSNLNMTTADDPLEEANISESSDSSNNIHIQNYDSILNDLNKITKTRKYKEGDTSLNIDKKPKQKSVPIVDQLNLTQTKLKKIKQNDVNPDNSKKYLKDKSKREFINRSIHQNDQSQMEIDSNKGKSKTTEDGDNESSSSIDLHLLFSNESSDSDVVKNKDMAEVENNEVNKFIPLQKSHGKTNIFETSRSNNKSHTESPKKKKNKSKSLDQSNIEADNSVDEDKVQFFEDTTGNLNLKNQSFNVYSANHSAIQQHLDVRLDNDEMGDGSDSDAPMEVSSKIKQESDIADEINTYNSSPLNKSKTRTPKSDKKKKRKESLTREETGVADKSIDRSVSKTPKSEKKKSKRTSESQRTEEKDLDPNTLKIVNDESLIQSQKVDIEEVFNTSFSAKNESINKTSRSNKKKKNIEESQTMDETDATKHSHITECDIEESENQLGNISETKDAVISKNRKRKSSLHDIEQESKDVPDSSMDMPTINVSTTAIRANKKRKISHTVEDSGSVYESAMTNVAEIKNQRKQDTGKQEHPLIIQTNNKKNTIDVNIGNKKGTKKRKEPEDDEESKIAKVLKVNNDDKLRVTRLPTNILNQLEDRPAKKNHQYKKTKAIATTKFVVEDAKVKKTKPSNYLEESIYLNEEEIDSKKQKHIKNPKVLPFLPTVSTSNSGYTTAFKVNVLPKKIQFVAKSESVKNYKEEYLQNKKVKRLGTYDLYKRKRIVKMSKF